MATDTGRPADIKPQALSLPAFYYIDPAHHAAELERFFGGMWVHAGREGELPEAGDYVLRDVAGESLILTRGADGVIRAFYNVCRHRGTRLCETSSGRFDGVIRCPYHAWAYDLGGRLTTAPQMHDLADFHMEDHPLATVAVDLWDGHIFVNLKESPLLLADQLGYLPQKFRPWSMAQLRLVKRVTYLVAANWKLIIQNYSECLHCPGVHPALQRLSHFLSGQNEPAHPGYLGGRMDLRDGAETLSTDGRLTGTCLPGLSADDRRKVYYYAVLPNLLLSLHPDYMMTHTLCPRSVDRTEIVCEWHFHPDAMGSPVFRPEAALAFWDTTNRQDWHVCEQMQLGVRSRAYRPGPYSRREDLLYAFDRMIERTCETNVPPGGTSEGSHEPATRTDRE